MHKTDHTKLGRFIALCDLEMAIALNLDKSLPQWNCMPVYCYMVFA